MSSKQTEGDRQDKTSRRMALVEIEVAGSHDRGEFYFWKKNLFLKDRFSGKRNFFGRITRSEIEDEPMHERTVGK
jgi:hypothetical protein